MPFEIIRNDITRVEADAIVNTANPLSEVGGGTDWAIHTAAGPALLKARREIGEIPVGRAAATPAFGLRAKYVLHTVGPAWVDGRHGEEELLYKAYDSALSLAERLGCRSVAFPLLSAGTYGFPRDKALSVAIRAFTDFLLDHEMQILLVLFNAEAFGMAGSLFDGLKSYIDDNYVEEQEEKEYRADSLSAALPPVGNRKEGKQRERRSRRPEIAAAESACFDALPAAPPFPGRPAEGSSLEELIRRQQESSFREYLTDLLRERGGKMSEVYKRAEISKQIFSNLLNKEDYQPTRNTVIQLAIGLQLDMARTQKLLNKAGYALTRGSKRDLAIQYFIEREIYSVTFINEALFDCGYPLLSTGSKA